MRVSLASMMYLRNPLKVSAPAEPASSTVVAPCARQVGIGRNAVVGNPFEDMHVRVDQTRCHSTDRAHR